MQVSICLKEWAQLKEDESCLHDIITIVEAGLEFNESAERILEDVKQKLDQREVFE